METFSFFIWVNVRGGYFTNISGACSRRVEKKHEMELGGLDW